MRKSIIASAIALGAAFSFGGIAEAASITVQTGPTHHKGPIVVEHMHHRHHRHCVDKKIITHRHGKRIVRMERVCR